MNITESDRRNIFVRLEAVVGRDVAETIMELLPHQPHDQLATRTDLATLSAETAGLRAEMAEFSSLVRADVTQPQTEVTEFRNEIVGEINRVETVVQHEITRLRSELIESDDRLTGQITKLGSDANELGVGLRGAMRNTEGRMQRWAVGILATNVVALAAALVL